ncbi:uncharacterized protein ACHE_31004A [Aspergillus chevalieri]|uniref:Uncharacterized protein n=1 Tax=Aspergillus chevalieri TaxID=182096 RepID=A0A7R7ZN95_ASPCH|nr:uncharacterized protein ACHE_31004A [Aspergillus chevalieri]BCR87017.1 hypothetical protein ACHE_31004A [Aspergillus chevalieri]
MMNILTEYLRAQLHLRLLVWSSHLSSQPQTGLAVFTCMVGVSSTNITPNHIPLFPQSSPGTKPLAVANVIFAYAGHVAAFIFSELEDLIISETPRNHWRFYNSARRALHSERYRNIRLCRPRSRFSSAQFCQPTH